MDKVILHEHGRYRPVMPDRPKPDDNWPYHGHPTTPFDPEFGIKNPKVERHIFVRHENIFFAIDSQLGMMARARRKPDGTEDETIAHATEAFRPMFCSWIDTHIGEAKTTMSAFVLERFRKGATNDIKDSEETDIALLMPKWYDDTTFKQLKDAVNNYVVDATLYDYFAITLTAKDPVTQSKEISKNNLLGEIKKLANMAKPGSVKKKMKPF